MTMDKRLIRDALEQHNYTIIEEKRYQNRAWRFKLSNGLSVFCGDAGKIWCAGKGKEQVELLLKPFEDSQINNRVFIVYGRNVVVRDELCDMLRSWNIEPYAIDSLPTQGRTIIEQLEHYIPQTNYGIVLATPDDIGYLAGHEKEAKYRARQNVVLELGMLFAKLGRSRVAIILQRCDTFEKPSDIGGILYLEYESSISEIAKRLKKELNTHGYNVT